MAIIRFRDLPKIRERFRDKTIVVSSGSFDIPHAGHALFLEDCKSQGDIFVVVVGDDASIRDIKGKGRPVVNQHARLKMVDSIKSVDYCFVGSRPKTHPLSFMESVFQALKPDKYVVNNDAFDIPKREKLAEDYGMKLVILKRKCPKSFEGVSTTKIIEKVLKLQP